MTFTGQPRRQVAREDASTVSVEVVLIRVAGRAQAFDLTAVNAADAGAFDRVQQVLRQFIGLSSGHQNQDGFDPMLLRKACE